MRDDVRPGLRITNYKKCTVIAFDLDAGQVFRMWPGAGSLGMQLRRPCRQITAQFDLGKIKIMLDLHILPERRAIAHCASGDPHVDVLAEGVGSGFDLIQL